MDTAVGFSRRHDQRVPALTAVLALGVTAIAILGLATQAVAADAPLVVGAKKFTESAILAELMAQVLEQQAGVEVERRLNFGGTDIVFDALRSGAVDLYAEYTGTGLRDILHDASPIRGPADAFARASASFSVQYDLLWLAPFGFNNTYAVIMRADRARALNIATISDAASHPLRYGVSHEFLQRADGMPGLQAAYALRVQSLVGMEHDLAYAALREDGIDVSDGYSTDAKIVDQHLVVLRDDRNAFPPYEGAPLVRRDLLTRVPLAAGALALLAGRIDDATMQRLNHQVEAERRSPAEVAATFLHASGIGLAPHAEAAPAASLPALLWQRRAVTLRLTGWHLTLTGVAEVLACAVAIPLGIGVRRHPRLAAGALGAAGVLQTVPSIALLALMLPFFGIGARPAIVALFLYGLLPILRNTITALRGIDPTLIEVGLGLGMRPAQLLWRVELPLAIPVILAGIRISSVINVGTATLAAFIGAGGLGDPIVTGLATTDTNLVLAGALPAAVLAVLVDGSLAAVEDWATPRGLKLRRPQG